MLVNAYATSVEPPELPFPHEMLGQRNWRDPELQQHLAGMAGFIRAQCGDSLTELQRDLLGHVSRVHTHWSFEVDEEHFASLTGWAIEANSVVFLADSTIRDPLGRVILEPQTGESRDGAQVPMLPHGIARKEAITEALRSRGIATLDSLPALPADAEVILPPATTVIGRLSALTLTAIHAESALNGHPVQMKKLDAALPFATKSMTPTERAFADNPDPEQAKQLVWRYECLPPLMWALGHLTRLDPPAGTVDAGEITTSVVESKFDQIESKVRLRPVSELLDQADLTYRMHWAVRNAQVGTSQAPHGVDPGVVRERHHAFKWLIDPRVPWDQVQLDT